MNDFSNIENSGLLKDWYSEPVGTALRKRRLKLAETKGISSELNDENKTIELLDRKKSMLG